MPVANEAARAYAASAGHRGVREQEADVFRRTNAVLRRAHDAGGTQKVRALADNQRLWGSVIDLMRDPENKLPADLRAAVVSVGLAVQREMVSADPDTEFLIDVNENVAVGLTLRPSTSDDPRPRSSEYALS